MDAVGNDLVWLGDPANQGRHHEDRLMGRILCSEERRFVETAGEPHRTLWSLWAAKEAAYKAYVRTRPGSVFSPIAYRVVAGSEPCVWHAGAPVPLVWDHGPDWVHALVGHNPREIVPRVESSFSPEKASEDLRALAVRIFGEAGWPPGTIEGRPPLFWVDGRPTALAFSLSHDGPYLAVAFRSTPFRSA